MAASKECIIQRRTGYTVMSNYHLRDKRLSLKAKGLLSVILSLPEDWDYTIAGLAVICDCGRDMIRAAITELEKAGYITRTQINESGKFGSNQYVIRETPVEQPAEPLPGFPATENPPTGNPLPENPTELIKDELITDELNTPPAAPAETGSKKTRGKREKAEPEDQLDDGQMRNLLILRTAEMGQRFCLLPDQLQQLQQIAIDWYKPRTLKGKNATPPLHTERSVTNLLNKVSRGISRIGAAAAIEVFNDALCKGYTDIYDARFKVDYEPPSKGRTAPAPQKAADLGVELV